MNEVFITDQQIDQRLAKSHLPGQHLDIALKADGLPCKSC